jgi:hypothetical protein
MPDAPYTVKREIDDEGDISYALIVPSREEPIGDLHRELINLEGKSTLWSGNAHVSNDLESEFDIAIVGPTLRATARALYLAIRTIVNNE